MNLKKLLLIMMILMLTLSLFTGCKSNVPDEEEAVSDSIVEGEEQEMSGDTPEIVEPGNGNAQQGGNEQEGNETPDNTTPDNKEPEKEDNTPVTDNKEPEKEDNTPSTDNEASTPDNNEGETEEPDDNSALEDVDEGNFLKIVAYNLRVADDGGGNNVLDRMPRFHKLMDEIQPDIMGLSECGTKHIKYIEQNIVGSKYKMLYKYRAEDSLEAQPLLFDQTKFELLDDGYFWLSETPDIPSKGWGGAHYRGATWALLKVKATGRQFLYYSTHLTGSDAAVVGSCNLVVNHATKFGGFSKIPVFCTGDFNTEPWSVGYTEFVKYFNDVNEYIGFDKTFTNGGYTENGGGNHIIDYVMASQDNVIPTKYQVLNKFVDGGAISDHEGLYVECYLK